MLQREQFKYKKWLKKSAAAAYKSSGHVLHPDELAKGLSDPAEYITEHAGMDPAELEGLSPKHAGKELAKGIRRTASEHDAWMEELRPWDRW